MEVVKLIPCAIKGKLMSQKGRLPEARDGVGRGEGKRLVNCMM
jgi:hypothetical protein